MRLLRKLTQCTESMLFNPFYFVKINGLINQTISPPSPHSNLQCFSLLHRSLFFIQYSINLYSHNMRFLKEPRKSMPSSMTDHMRNSSRKQMLTYSYLLVYIALSSDQIFFNKVFFSFLH